MRIHTTLLQIFDENFLHIFGIFEERYLLHMTLLKKLNQYRRHRIKTFHKLSRK